MKCQTEKNTVWYHLYMKSKNCNKLVNITKKKQTHRYREQICLPEGSGNGGWVMRRQGTKRY